MLTVLEAAAHPAIDLEIVKTSLRIDGPDDDAFLTHLIAAGTDLIESHIGKILVEKTLQWQPPPQPQREYSIPLPVGPVRTLKAVHRVLNGQVDDEPLACRLVHTLRAPVVMCHCSYPVAVIYTAGYGTHTTHVPPGLQLALLTLVTHLFEHRATPQEIPQQIHTLLRHYRSIHL